MIWDLLCRYVEEVLENVKSKYLILVTVLDIVKSRGVYEFRVILLVKDSFNFARWQNIELNPVIHKLDTDGSFIKCSAREKNHIIQYATRFSSFKINLLWPLTAHTLKKFGLQMTSLYPTTQILVISIFGYLALAENDK